jgi:predicted nucleic acid-binding protein
VNIVDSSGWLEYFSRGANSDQFALPLQDPESLIVPVITIYEVFKVVLRESGENQAFQAVAAMQKGTVVDLSTSIAMKAAKLGLQHGLPMADSIILAMAQASGCVIWTQDSDFENLPDVRFFPKTKAGPTS